MPPGRRDRARAHRLPDRERRHARRALRVAYGPRLRRDRASRPARDRLAASGAGAGPDVAGAAKLIPGERGELTGPVVGGGNEVGTLRVASWPLVAACVTWRNAPMQAIRGRNRDRGPLERTTTEPK